MNVATVPESNMKSVKEDPNDLSFVINELREKIKITEAAEKKSREKAHSQQVTREAIIRDSSPMITQPTPTRTIMDTSKF